MPETTAAEVGPTVIGPSTTPSAEEPKVLDTYSVVYSFVLLMLVPSMLYLQSLPFTEARHTIYTFGYVSAVTVPFLLGLILTFTTDSRDTVRTVVLRILILTPLIVLTAVTVLFTSALVVMPVAKHLGFRNQGLSPFFWTSLAIVAAPLFPALGRRIRAIADPRTALQAFSIAVSIALVLGLAYFTLVMNGDYSVVARKDAVIYVVGALTWYAPSFAIAAGAWRRTGLI